MITVITPTVREKGLELVKKALDRQSFTDFEWIIVRPEGKKPKGLYWTLYRDYNRGVKQAKGELIVSWQDYTYANPDILQRLWFHHQREPKTLVGVVGNKYENDTWMVKTWHDPRQTNDKFSFYPCAFSEVEWNLCAVPTEALYAVGGFDEDLDKYSSLCGADVAVRLEILGGYTFKVDQTIKTFSTEHGRLPGWEENSPFGKVWLDKLEQYKENPVLTYLKNEKVNK